MDWLSDLPTHGCHWGWIMRTCPQGMPAWRATDAIVFSSLRLESNLSKGCRARQPLRRHTITTTSCMLDSQGWVKVPS